MIVVLHQGRIAEQGTHTHLLARGGLYADLYEKQLLREALEAEDLAEPVEPEPGLAPRTDALAGEAVAAPAQGGSGDLSAIAAGSAGSGGGAAASTDWVKSARAAGTAGVHVKTLSHPPPNSIAYSLGPIATFVILYVGDGSVSNVLGPDVWIRDSELLSTLYFECSVTQAVAFDHFASQSAPA